MTFTPVTTSWAKAHPRLFWSSSDVPRLRRRASHPRLAPTMERSRAASRACLDPGHEKFVDPKLGRADLIGDSKWSGMLFARLPDLLMTAVIDEDPEAIARLIDVVGVLVNDPEPARATVLGERAVPDMFDAPERPLIAAQAGMLPLIVDALYDQMPTSLQAQATAFLRERVAQPFADYLLGPALRRLSLGINLAWWDFNAGLWSLACVCDPDRPTDLEAMAMAADTIRRGLHMGVDEVGIIGEGPFYGNIDASAWAYGAEILARSGVADLWADAGAMRRLAQGRLNVALPGMRELLDHNDTFRDAPTHASLFPNLLCAARLGMPEMQTLWERLGGESLPYLSNFAPLGVWNALLWLDPDHGGELPDPQTHATRAGGARWGVNIVRTGWDDEDLFFALHAAGRDPGTFIHQHADAGHFALAALGEVFAAGRGYGHTRASYHNVMTYGDLDPNAESLAMGQVYPGGVTRDFAPGELADYISVDIAWQQQSCWSHRHALVVRAPGAEPYILLLDHSNPDNDWVRHRWTMQVSPDHTVTVDPDAARATVRGRVHRLETAWVCPQPADYARPHRLEILTDRTPPVSRKDLDRSGGEGYPRLIAQLDGLNGILLTALLPRRADAPPAGITPVHGSLQLGMTIDHGEVIDTVVASPIDRWLNVGGFAGEAAIALARRDRAGRLVYAALADGYALDIADKPAALPRQDDRAPLREWSGG